jgi:GNAT superfamily N-acetyltransferase
MATMNIRPATEAETKLLDDKLVEHNNAAVPFTQTVNPLFLNFTAEDQGRFVGGINADMYHWGMTYIGLLFVDPKYRDKNLGTELLQRVEQEAKSAGSTLIHLDTFDFQAKDFYLKHGYEIFGVLDDCPPGHQRFYMKKKL